PNSDGSSLIAEVVLPAHARVRTPVAQERLVGPDRELAALDGVDDRQQRRLPVRERLDRILQLAERRLLLERDVAGARDRPGAPVPPLERLLRADPVDRQLQRAFLLRR